jgi:hypothetical protein
VKPFAPAQAQFIIKGIFSLSGVCDVIVFKYARSGLLLFDAPKSTPLEKPEMSPDIELDQLSRHNTHESDTASESKSKSAKSVRDGPLRRYWKFGAISPFLVLGYATDMLVVFWLILNAFDAVWIVYCLWMIPFVQISYQLKNLCDSRFSGCYPSKSKISGQPNSWRVAGILLVHVCFRLLLRMRQHRRMRVVRPVC